MSEINDTYAALTREDVPVIEREEILDQSGPTAGEQRVDISELLIAMKNAIERMSVHNTHRGIMVTAGSVIIHLITENRKLAEICEGYHQASMAHAEALSLEDPAEPLVSLT
jgi:hypothetical protein